jgi:hypothetical protein
VTGGRPGDNRGASGRPADGNAHSVGQVSGGSEACTGCMYSGSPMWGSTGSRRNAPGALPIAKDSVLTAPRLFVAVKVMPVALGSSAERCASGKQVSEPASNLTACSDTELPGPHTVSYGMFTIQCPGLGWSRWGPVSPNVISDAVNEGGRSVWRGTIWLGILRRRLGRCTNLGAGGRRPGGQKESGSRARPAHNGRCSAKHRHVTHLCH